MEMKGGGVGGGWGQARVKNITMMPPKIRKDVDKLG
jgi:hypothetical protein